jgi:predicted nuclease of restriction endonuclease-like (RecB) superfamily
MAYANLEYVNCTILQPLVAEIPWAHNIAIMSRVYDLKAREYYIKATIELGWSKNVLIHQIKDMAYERHTSIEKQNNFEPVLPEHLAEQADFAMKDSYMLDFLGIKKPIVEAHLEQQMVIKIKQVIMELGFGFAFIGNQYKVKTPSNDYFIDLLFYNRYLKCLVAVELKVGAFKPEYAGKMNFYLNILDDFVRAEDDNPSIGIILCTERDRFEVEYALRGLNKPVGVAEYRLTRDLPKELVDKLPSAKVLEQELNAVMQMELFVEE